MKAYIYPLNKRKYNGLYNPYIDNFVGSLNTSINFLNYKNPSQIGILDLWRYLWKIDIIILNWIENIPDKKGGKLQWQIFQFFFLPILKFRNVKICWTLHNKLSHSKKNIKLKVKIFEKLFSISDYIITHANEGKMLVDNKGCSNKLIFFHHPINKRFRTKSTSKETDIFIWGTISPYKAIDVFLDQVSYSSIMKQYNILIAGKIVDLKYKAIIEKKTGSNIKLIDRFLSDEELEENLRNSKITLFTYNEDSILSSGALSDSIGYGNIIVGPEVGSFKDLKDEHIIYTYKEIGQISSICDKLLSDFAKYQIDESLISNYLANHSWQNFAQTVMNKINC